MALMLRPTLAQLDAIAPRFSVPPSAISVTTTPEDFYSQLKTQILGAKRRVFLASLYIGKTESELIEVLDKRLGQNTDLDVHILTDGLRGTREAPRLCSVSLLAPLIAKYPARVHVSAFQTPRLSGLKKILIPKRFNEGWGLQHMKLYGIDDQITLSGANLSHDYFTNRQDRYITIANKEVTDYFYSVYHAVASLSYQAEYAGGTRGIHDNFRLTWKSNFPDHQEDHSEYMRSARKLLKPLLAPRNKPINDHKGTFIYPICQFTPLIGLEASNEFKAMDLLTNMLKGPFDWALTAGYFNISKTLQNNLFNSTPNEATVITAGEKANGFYDSKGLSSRVPGLYSMLARRFISRAEKLQPKIQLLEWEKGVHNRPNGWSYHAKGLWVMPKGEDPVLTVIGSSNFTRRAYSHDLEAGAVLVTDDTKLRRRLGEELHNLTQHTATKTSRDYKPPSVIDRIFVSMMGDKL